MQALPTDDLLAEFAVGHLVHPAPAPSWNVAPTDRVSIVIERVDAQVGTDTVALRELRVARWGLVPHWAKDRAMGARMINARSETITERPAFTAAAARRRCLIPANGYFEWMTSGPAVATRRSAAKTPYYLHDPHHEVLALAGLYEIWRDPALPDDHPAALLWTCTVITRAAPDALGHIHDRTPVVVPAHLRDDWLDCADRRTETARELLAEIPPPRLEPREVGPAVGSVRNNSPQLIQPAEARLPDQLF